MKKRKLMKGNKRSTYMSGCIMAVVTLAISQLQLGKINDAIWIEVVSFLIILILNQLAKLVWDK